MNNMIFLLQKAVISLVVAAFLAASTGCNRSDTLTGGQPQDASPSADASGNDLPDEVRLDYAYWSPVGLVLRNRGFLEEDLAKDNVRVSWIFSLGSNKSMEYLMSNSIDIGSSAGVAALISFSNGNPIKTVYISTTPEWTAMLLKPGSEIKEIADLKGKTLAATPGTDPYVFMVRTLALANLTLNDVNLIPLQHPDGKNELIRGRIDAWAGLDPLMAQAELEGATYLYRNVDFNTYNVISVRQEFAEKYPELVTRVLAAYEKARQWARDHPEEYLALVVKEARITDEEGKLLLQRTGLEDAAISDKLVKTLVDAGNSLKPSGVIKEDADVEKLVADLTDGSYFETLGK